MYPDYYDILPKWVFMKDSDFKGYVSMITRKRRKKKPSWNQKKRRSK